MTEPKYKDGVIENIGNIYDETSYGVKISTIVDIPESLLDKYFSVEELLEIMNG